MLRMLRAGGGMGVLWVAAAAVLLGGCAVGNQAAVNAESAPAAKPPSADVAGDASESPAASPAESVARADSIYRDQLASQGRDERFSTDRQVAELQRAILLYEQFIARAENDPRFAEAVRRSRDRVADARATIDFLRQEAAGPQAVVP